MDDLLVKYLLGEASPEEISGIERWLEADAANRARLEQFNAVWNLSQGLAQPASTSADQESVWLGLKDKLNHGSIPDDHDRARKTPVRRMRRMIVAAALTGVLLIGIGIYALLNWNKQTASMGTTVAGARAPGIPGGGEQARGASNTQAPGASASQGALTAEMERTWFAGPAPRTDTLPGGSVVTLNRGSSLGLFGTGAARERIFQLAGEGFFSVRHNPARAFVVRVNDLTITVLGTSFELNGKGEDSVVLVVETGAVRVSGDGRLGPGIEVRASERLSIPHRGPWKLERNRDRLYAYYLGRPLICDGIPLRRLVAVLNQEYGAHVVLGRRELGDLRLTAEFREEPLDKILAVLAATFNLSIVRHGPSVILQ